MTLMVLINIFFSNGATGQENSCKTILKRKLAKFSSASDSSLEQIIELCQASKLPVGIEWLSDDQKKVSPISFENQSVEFILNEIISHGEKLGISVQDKIVNIFSYEIVNSDENFLNITIDKYQMFHPENLIFASCGLRDFIEGVRVGSCGYGNPDDDFFSEKKIFIQEENITVREILNKFAISQGNALWVTCLTRKVKMTTLKKFFAQTTIQSTAPVQTKRFYWQFLHLPKEE